MLFRDQFGLLWTLFTFQLMNFVLSQTKGGNSNGQPCRFPFIYKGTMYSNCITKDYKRLWCATTPNYDEDALWGDCKREDAELLPIFVLTTEDNITRREGADVRFECKIRNLYGKKVSWQKKGAAFPLTIARHSFLDDGKYVAEMVDSAHWNLYIYKVSVEDSGVYQCRIITRTMLLVRDFQLTIEPIEGIKKRHDKLKTPLPDELIKVSVNQGSRFQLNCSSRNIARVNTGVVTYKDSLTWIKDNKEVLANSQTGIKVDNYVHTHSALSALSVEKAHVKHTGRYVCASSSKTHHKYWVQVHNRNVNMSRDQPVLLLSSTSAPSTVNLPKNVQRILKKEPRNDSNRLGYSITTSLTITTYMLITLILINPFL